MLIGPPWVKRHSKPNPYTLTWENDVIHYSVPVGTFSPRFRVQSMPLNELSPLTQTGCKSAHHGSNTTRNQIPIPVSYTHLRAHETDSYLVCRLLLEKKKNIQQIKL